MSTETFVWFAVGVALLALAILVVRGSAPPGGDRPPTGIEGGPSWPA